MKDNLLQGIIIRLSRHLIRTTLTKRTTGRIYKCRGTREKLLLSLIKVVQVHLAPEMLTMLSADGVRTDGSHRITRELSNCDIEDADEGPGIGPTIIYSKKTALHANMFRTSKHIGSPTKPLQTWNNAKITKVNISDQLPESSDESSLDENDDEDDEKELMDDSRLFIKKAEVEDGKMPSPSARRDSRFKEDQHSMISENPSVKRRSSVSPGASFHQDPDVGDLKMNSDPDVEAPETKLEKEASRRQEEAIKNTLGEKRDTTKSRIDTQNSQKSFDTRQESTLTLVDAFA